MGSVLTGEVLGRGMVIVGISMKPAERSIRACPDRLADRSIVLREGAYELP